MSREKRQDGNVSTDEEVEDMPTVESVECERVAYIKGMEDYLRKLRLMTDSEAVKKSRKSLESCNIIQEDGEFSERYGYSRKYAGQGCKG